MSVNIAAVMAKFPELSKVKTRLASTIGDMKALEVYKILLDNLSDRCIPTTQNSYQLGCFLTPQNLINEFQSIYDFYAFYKPQQGGNLGERMKHAFQNILEDSNADKAILIGADIPHLDRNIIEDAFTKLSTDDIVIGPTDDGGYYLIGINIIHNELFDRISWGTSKVLDETINICQQVSLSIGFLGSLSDLDTQEDLESYPEILKKMQ